jgi:hypothetical protein
MAAQPVDYLQTPTEELLREYIGSAINPASNLGSSFRLIIETRNAADQAKQAQALTTATGALVSVTRRLAWATWVLVALTFVMAIAQIIGIWKGAH